MGKTAIEWAEETWNPVVGCTKASTECKNCYAERLHRTRYRAWLDGWTDAPEQYHEPFERVRLIERRLDEPKRWRKPRAVFCCSMGDLFHEDVPARDVLAVLNTMEQVNTDRIHAGREPHRFMVLTKRSRRMRDILETWFDEFLANSVEPTGVYSIWFGVSVGVQGSVDRAFDLASIRSPVPLVRFVSAEPLLGPVGFAQAQRRCCDGEFYNLLTGEPLGHDGQPLPGRINWIIVGGETGPGARPMHPDWAQSLRDEAGYYGVPFFFKQWGEYVPAWGENDPTIWLDRYGGIATDPHELSDLENPIPMRRVGRRAAGRELDGLVWEQYPAQVTP